MNDSMGYDEVMHESMISTSYGETFKIGAAFDEFASLLQIADQQQIDDNIFGEDGLVARYQDFCDQQIQILLDQEASDPNFKHVARQIELWTVERNTWALVAKII
ncbi:hypothetical protein HK102_014159, partial [Quaeritorhiza haematococci]